MNISVIVALAISTLENVTFDICMHYSDCIGPALWYDGQLEPTVGSFRKFVFFLFAPTLLYRDNYPR